MSLIISENGKGAQRLIPSGFEKEKYLQQYIYDNPDAVPVYDIDEDIHLVILAREFRTESGPIDALGVDQNGNIYLIETKLFFNQDKRTVVAQVLDYGASLWSSSLDFNDFTTRLDRHVQQQFHTSLQLKLQEFFELDDIALDILLNNMQLNLSNGIFKFIVLMDELHRQLKDMIVFLNRNSQFDVYAVELEYYKHNSYEIIIPKLYGAEVKKDVVSKSKSNVEPWLPADGDVFKKEISARYKSDECTETSKKTILELLDMYTQIAIQTGGSTAYWFRPANNDVRFLAVDNNKKVFLIIDSSCRVEGWPGKRTGKQIDFVKSLEEQMIARNLFGRAELSKSSWGINLRKDRSSDEEINEFLQINKAAYENLNFLKT